MVLCGVSLVIPAAGAAVWPVCLVCSCCMPAEGCLVLVAHHTRATEHLLLWASPGCPSHKTLYNNITYVIISKSILMTVSFIINNISVEL